MARGSGCGSTSGSAAEVNPKAGFGFKASCRLSRLETDSHACFPGGNCARWRPAPFAAHFYVGYQAVMTEVLPLARRYGP